MFPFQKPKIHPDSTEGCESSEPLPTSASSGDDISGTPDVFISFIVTERIQLLKGECMFSEFDSWGRAVHLYSALLSVFNNINVPEEEKERNKKIAYDILYTHLNDTFTCDKVARELRAMATSSKWKFSGALCRFIHFMTVLHKCPKKHVEWTRIFSPILNEVEKLIDAWLSDLLADPLARVDTGSSEDNTAHCLLLVLEGCESGVCPQFYLSVCKISMALYSDVVDLSDDSVSASAASVGLGDASLSPALCVAALMSRLCELGRGPPVCPDLFSWLKVAISHSVWTLKDSYKSGQVNGGAVVLDSDMSDIQLQSMCSSNLHRSKCLASIASVLLSDWKVGRGSYIVNRSENRSGCDEVASAPFCDREEMASTLLRSANDVNGMCLQLVVSNTAWKSSDMMCHLVDSWLALRRAALAINIDDSWRKLSAILEEENSSGENKADVQVPPDINGRSWRNVKVWIATAPNDSAEERKAIHETVLPALNEWAHKYKIRVIPCDLCQMVTEDPTKRSDERCLADIRGCKDANGGSLIMVSVLSGSYGQCVEPSASSSMNEVHRDISTLHLQIAYGAMKDDNENALFFVRRMNACHGNVSLETTESFNSSEKLRHLKQHVRRSFPIRNVLEYEHDPIVSLSDFSSSLLNELKSKISELYSEQNKVEAASICRDEHNWHYTNRPKVFFGRESELSRIKEYLEQPEPSEELKKERENESNTVFQSLCDKATENIWKSDVMSYVRDKISLTEEEVSDTELWSMVVEACPTVKPAQNEIDDWEFAVIYNDFLPGWTEPLFLCADYGTGKTQLLCKAAKDFDSSRKNGDGWLNSVVHFPDLCLGSSEVDSIIHKIGYIVRGEDFSVLRATTNEQKSKLLWKLFHEAFVSKRKLAIFVDDIHKFISNDEDAGVQKLSWLPTPLPPNIKFIATVLVSTPTFNHIESLDTHPLCPTNIFRLSDFGRKASSQLVVHFMNQNGITWSEEDIGHLLSKPMCTTSPQYLLAACGEMQLVKELESFEDEVLCLPYDIANMCYWVIDRVVEKGGATVLLTLCVLDAAWPGGVNEVTLMQLLGDTSAIEELSMDPWPGGSVHKCKSLDAFFESTKHRNPGAVFAGAVGHQLVPLRRMHSEGDMCEVDEGATDNNDMYRLLRMDSIGELPLNSSRKQALSYLDWCNVLQLLRGSIGIVERSGIVNFTHVTFRQAVHDYCILFEEEDDAENVKEPSPGSVVRKKTMRRQSSLERKYFSSGGELLFKRSQSHFRNLLQRYSGKDQFH